MADSDVSDSSSDEDDFLTLDKGGEKLDREALVRKKLLENFYGKAAVQDAGPGSNDLDDDFLEDDDDDMPTKLPSGGRGVAEGANDLDSPAFDAEAHTRQHVIKSDIHTLLDTEEKLALSVRTLDTEMQALVYENYTRFIDATDAIRSIGVNVQANEKGMERLSTGMASIDEHSKKVEDSLGSLRDQVAEKIRVKRLLTRLDTLLKLPQTLREQIADGHYRSACKQFLSASSILSKHSEGFESLKTIETECNSILQDMKDDLQRKLSHWSGRGVDDDYGTPLDAPKNMRAIFECSGTLSLLYESEAKKLTPESELETSEVASDLQAMSLSAAMRLLDRLLDTHMIEMQERRFSSPSMVEPATMDSLGASMTSTHINAESTGNGLIPCDVLDGILEVSKLWIVSFGQEVAGNGDIIEFVSEAFASFLMHVRAILLDETMQGIGQEESENEEDVSVALAVLVRTVEELARGLAQPEVGISADFASSLVQQAMSLTESMVRRRVDQKFLRLRLSIVQNCLLPFVARSVQERADSIAAGKPPLGSMIQIANVTLSDCLQLVDDAIRSIVAPGDGGPESVPSPDVMILKQAVHGSTNRFTSWLASAFEVLAGGESSDPMRIIETEAVEGQEGNFEHSEYDLGVQQNTSLDGLDDIGADSSTVVALIDEAYEDILRAGGDETDTVHSDFILSIAEMCRLAQGSVSDVLEQSLVVHLGGHKKKSTGMFKDGKKQDSEFSAIAHRFQIASSRLLVMYTSNRGSEVADRITADLSTVAAVTDTTKASGPRDATLKGLELIRETAIECAEMYGEKLVAGPIPNMHDGRFSSLSPSAAMARKTGLHLDVERMFKEKVAIYPHPSEIVEPSSNMVVFLVLKVAFRALLERARMSTFSEAGYRQFQVDADLLKLMLPHYISADFSVNGSNANASLSNILADSMQAAGERCLDEEAVDNDDIKRQSTNVLAGFMAAINTNEVGKRIIIHVDAEE